MTPETEANIREFSATSDGWCQTPRALEMAQLIIETKPQTVVEIGVFAGGSTIPQALALKELGQGKIYGIDPWSRQAAIEQVFVADDRTPAADEAVARDWWSTVDLDRMHLLCMQAIWKYGLEKHAIIIRARSEDCFELFRDIDIIYIDGSHSEEASCRDVSLYVPRVKPGGIVHIDDANWETVQKAVSMLDEHCALVNDAGQYRTYRKKAQTRGA